MTGSNFSWLVFGVTGPCGALPESLSFAPNLLSWEFPEVTFDGDWDTLLFWLCSFTTAVETWPAS
jgi:hypothetical protein